MAGVSAFGYTNYAKRGSLTANSNEAGLSVSNLTSDQVSAAHGWQTAAGVVTSVDGAILRCDSPQSDLIWRYFILVGTNLTPAAQVTATLKNGTFGVSTLTATGPKAGYGQVVGVFDSDVTADFLQIEINDPTNPDGYINIGGMGCGPLWFPRTGISFDTSYDWDIQRIDRRTRGGQRFINHLYTKRRANIVAGFIRDSELHDDLGELIRIAALGVNVAFIPNARSIDIDREAIWGVLDGQTTSYQSGTIDSRRFNGTITER